jgi:aminopeptidase N
MRLVSAYLLALLVPGATLAQEPEPIEAGLAPPAGAYAPGVDVTHYEVEIGLGLATDWFAGSVTVHLVTRAASPVLPLDFTGLEIIEVERSGRAVAFTHRAGVLSVPLTGTAGGDEVEVTVRYRGVPDDGLILGNNVHGAPSAFVDNWPNRTRFWLPTVDHPADKATVRYVIHAPVEWRVVANGHLASGPEPSATDALGPAGDRNTWVWEVGVPISSYNMVIGAADMVVRSVGLAACGQAPASRREDGCVDVTYWVFPEDEQRAEPSFRRAAEMVDYFTETIGPYPFEKLANVQSATRFGGMENASAIFYSERGIAAGRNIEGTVSHEIAHQWFGDAVTEARWHHIWLSEGFATYFGALFFERADGAEALRERMEQSRQSILASDVTSQPIITEEESLFDLLNTNAYPKGGWVLHMLRGVLGDETFFAGIREYYRRHLHSAVLSEDFQAAMEDVAGQDLEWFFHQWLYEPGYPVFEVQDRWIEDRGVVEVTVRQTQDPTWPRFRMPAELLVTSGDQRVRHQVLLEGSETVFELPLPRAPSSVVLDPGEWILKGDVR